jgi:NAD(P)-dependent dehydrogenase (short-subunit alcohol dehydrogenase family)
VTIVSSRCRPLLRRRREPVCESRVVPDARSALVTGGSSGIGLALARMLLEEGFAVTLASRTQAKVEAAADALGCGWLQADVAQAEDCARVVAEHVERHGGLDLLVNSAGIGIAGRIEDAQLRHVDRQLNVNLRGLVLVTQAAIPHLRRADGAWIVNLASIAGTAPVPILPIYAATKAAVISLTHTLNADLEEDGIRAIALCPGFVDTPMTDFTGLPGEEMIQPEDCAEVIRMCLQLSPRASIGEVVIRRVGGDDAA